MLSIHKIILNGLLTSLASTLLIVFSGQAVSIGAVLVLLVVFDRLLGNDKTFLLRILGSLFVFSVTGLTILFIKILTGSFLL